MIVVTGATGPVGRLLIAQLLAEGARVRAVSRTPQRSGLPDGAELVTGDPSQPATMPACFDGAEAVFLHPRTFGDSAGELLAVAAERGVRKVVALSAINIDDPYELQPSRRRGDRNKEAEQAAMASGLAWTSLRASSFAGNTAQAWVPSSAPATSSATCTPASARPRWTNATWPRWQPARCSPTTWPDGNWS